LPLTIGESDLARYPFLNEAIDYVRNYLDFNELDRPEYTYLIDRAAERVVVEAGGKVYTHLNEHKLQIDWYQNEIITFLVALMIIKTLGIESALRKFALFEAMRTEKFLANDLSTKSVEIRKALLYKIFQELFGVTIAIKDNTEFYKMKITDFLKRASPFHEEEWKLINQQVDKGYVYLHSDETVRLFRTELSGVIYNRVKTMNLQTLPSGVKKKVEELRAILAPRFEYGSIQVKEYPPCVKHAIDVMNRGENLPHSARLMLATYMLAIGKLTDEIVEMFKNAPDFNERITRYQVEHLAGSKGSRTKYSVPSCDKLRTENLCFATKDCDGIINPIQFGRHRK
jgi:DNA primase large subunit